MKRTLCLFLALILAVGICFSAPVTITASAAFTLESGTEHTVGAVYIDSTTGVKFKITDIETKQVEVCGYSNVQQYLVIPATVNISENGGGTLAYSVTAIGASAFANCTSLSSVVIPEGVITIGEDAFYFCKNIIGVTIPESVTSIVTGAFSAIGPTAKVKVPCKWDVTPLYEFSSEYNQITVTIADHAYKDGVCETCGYECPDHTYELAICTNCSYVCHHETVNDRVCQACGGTYCGKTESDTVVYFYNESTKTLTISGEGEMADFTNKTMPWYSYRSGITTIVINKGVTSIGEYSFSYCSALESVTIPESVTSIGSCAFYYCTALPSVTIPGSVTSIDSSAFNGCTSLTTVTIPSSVTTIESYAFNGCTSLTSVEIPSSVTKIDNRAFSGCTSLTTVTIPSSVTKIDNRAFSGCTSLTTVTIPSSVTTIESYAFEGCTSLTTIEIPDSVTKIGDNAFNGCTSLTTIEIPGSVTTIGANAFNNCTKLTTVNVPCSWNEKPLYTFEDGVEVVIPPHTIENNNCTVCKGSKCGATESDTVTWVYDKGTLYINGTGAMADFTYNTMPWYSYRSEITTIVINKGVTTIGVDAFYNCTALESVTIPGSVTSIGTEAFSYCSELPWVTIPNSVTTIGVDAFYNCTALESVTIPSSVTTIGVEAFRGCTALTTIEIPDSVTTIGSNAFYWCTALESIEIPDRVTTIGREAFYGCTALETVTIPSSVTSIGESAFNDCTKLTTVNVPCNWDGSVYKFAENKLKFADHDTTKTATCISKAECSVCGEYGDFAPHTYENGKGKCTVANCDNACAHETITDDDVCTTCDGKYCGADKTEDKVVWFFDEGTLTITGSGAMANYTGSDMPWCNYQNDITNVVIENGVTTIGSNAFYWCTALTSVTIPGSVTSIGDYAFWHCTSLTSVTIGEAVTTIGDGAFNRCTSLTSLTIPDSVTSIGDSAFSNCTSLTSVTIPGSVTTIGECAFSLCERLTSITIPQSVTSIGYYAFSFCTELIEIEVAEGNINYLSVDGILFNADKTELLCYPAGKKGNYEIPTTVTKIAPEAFSGNTLLKSVTIPYGVTSIGHNAFYECTSLTTVTIPDSVTTIGQQAFYGCTSLASVTIGDRVTTIGWQTFYGCTSLTSVTIGKGVTEIDDDAFEGCEDVNLIVEPGSYAHNYAKTKNITYTFNGYDEAETAQIEKLLFTLNDDSKSYSVTFCDTQISGALKIPATYNGKPVTEIGDSAFRDCIELTSVTIPDSITTIGGSAFRDCTELESVTIGDNVEEIGEYAFSNCGKLTSVTIPDSVTAIGEYAFFWCENLETVTIPDRVTTIGSDAFAYCRSLISVTIGKGVTTIAEDAFRGCTSLTTITVDDANKNYSSVKGVLFNKEKTELIYYPLGKEATSYTIPDGVTSIGGIAFYGCTALTSVTITDSVTTIGVSAFRDCIKLTSVTIPDSVNTIGIEAFYGCTLLETVTIPGIETTIGDNAFSDCPKVTLLVKEKSNAHAYASENNIEYITYVGGSGELGKLTFTPIRAVEGDDSSEITGYSVTDCDTSISGALTIPSEYNGKPVTAIGDNAFSNCTSLTSVEILPDSVKTIGENAFKDCSENLLLLVEGGSDLEEYAETQGIVYISFEITDEIVRKAQVVDCSRLITGSLTIPSEYSSYSVTAIDNSAFSECTGLTSVIIPKSVTTIGENAFANCDTLNSVEILGNVTIIGARTFEYCMSLSSITIPESVTEIGENAFADCNNLSSITIPEGVTTIGDKAFSNCTSLQTATIENGVTTIGEGAFSYCTTLSSITIPDSVTTIGKNAFDSCTNLESVTIGEKVGKIDDGTFGNCTSLKTIKIPDSVKTIGAYAFKDCSSLKEIAIPESVETIGAEAFYNCGNLKYIFFEGTEDSQKKLGDALVTNAKIHYGSSTHTFNENYTVDTEPTCTEKGSESQHCKYCEETQNSKEIKENGHTSVKGGTPDVHTKCDVCGVTLSAEHEFASKITTEPTCTKEGVKTFTCECGYTYTKPVATLGHDKVSHSAKSATCEAIGWYAYDTCSRCDYTTYVEKAKLGHDIVIDKAVEATCTATGLTEGSHCTRCNDKTVKQNVIPTKVHTEVTVTGKAATCTATGLTDGKKCSVCGTVTKAQQTIAKKGHTEVIIPKVAPTLTSTGLTEGKKCSVCGTVTVSQQVIAKLVLVAPVITSITSTTGGVKFTWGAVPYAAKYKIYRKTYHPSTGKWDAKWKKINKVEVKGTEYVDSTAKLGTQYMYLVKAVNGKVTKNSAASSIVTFKISPTPTIHLKSNGIKVKWAETVVSAENYRIYRAEYNESTKKYNSYKKVKTVKGTTKSWTDTSVKSGKKYKYCVKAVRGSVVCDKVQTKSMYYLTKPKVTVATATNGIVVNWSAKGASKYRVYRSELQNGVWSGYKEIATPNGKTKTYTDTTAVAGVQYKYKIKAVKSKTGIVSSATKAVTR